MGLKFKNNGNENSDIIVTILRNRGIEDIELFLKPNDSSDTNPFALKNMVMGIQVLTAHLSVYSKMAIVVDSDADGFLSASIIYQYLKSIDPLFEIDIIIPAIKTHGLTEEVMNELSKKEYELVIVPDAGSNDIKQIELLYAMGTEVIVLDHHIIEQESNCGVIINNQVSEDANKNLVGAGVAFKFCQAVDGVLGISKSDSLIDLAAIGQIADASDISENEVRNLVFKGIKNLNNKFLKEALLKKEALFPVPKDMSYTVIPMINAVIRVGTQEEKMLLFRAINNINPENFTVEKRKKNSEGKFDKIEVVLNLQQMAVDVAMKCKTRQDSAVKKAVAQVEKDMWTEGGVAIGFADIKEEHSSLTGLIATKMVNKLQKPVLLLREQDEKIFGSGRGYNPTMDSLKDWCQDTEAFEFAKGHDQAFGLELRKENLDTVKEKAKQVEARDFCYEVDYVSYGTVDKDVIVEIDNNKHIFGGKVHDPLFAYVGIEVPKKSIYAKGTVLTFKKDGVEFVMYGATPEMVEKYTSGFAVSHKLDFIGRPGVNNWLGKESIQIVLEAVDFSSEETPELEINEFNIIF